MSILRVFVYKIVHANFKSCKELWVVCALYAENGAKFTVTAGNKVRTKMRDKLND